MEKGGKDSTNIPSLRSVFKRSTSQAASSIHRLTMELRLFETPRASPSSVAWWSAFGPSSRDYLIVASYEGSLVFLDAVTHNKTTVDIKLPVTRLEMLTHTRNPTQGEVAFEGSYLDCFLRAKAYSEEIQSPLKFIEQDSPGQTQWQMLLIHTSAGQVFILPLEFRQDKFARDKKTKQIVHSVAYPSLINSPSDPRFQPIGLKRFDKACVISVQNFGPAPVLGALNATSHTLSLYSIHAAACPNEAAVIARATPVLRFLVPQCDAAYLARAFVVTVARARDTTKVHVLSAKAAQLRPSKDPVPSPANVPVLQVCSGWLGLAGSCVSV